MAWNDLTFVDCSLLTAAKMTALQGNFAALAAGEAGAPPLRIDAVSSLAWLHASSGVVAPQVSSLGTAHVSSGLLVPQVGSAGLLHASSGVVAPQVSSLGTVHVASAMVLGGAPAGTPQANALYAGNVPRAWIAFDGTGTVSIRDSFNVASLTDNGTGDHTVAWDRDFADANYCAVFGEVNAPVRVVGASSKLAGSLRVTVTDLVNNQDISDCSIAAFGAQP